MAEEYRPTMPAEQVERVRAWHEDAYRAARAEAGTDGQAFDYLGLALDVPPQVHPITGMSHLLGHAVLAEVRGEDRVLDMGTGCGVNAILAASVSSDVVAVDLNPYAVAAARRNVDRNDVGERVTVRHSDVFCAADGVFDLIVFDPPFRWFPARDALEMASTDAGYRALTTFFTEARDHLAPGGRMLVFFGSSGDLDYLRSLIAEHGFTERTVAHGETERNGWTVEYRTLLLRADDPSQDGKVISGT